MIDPDALKNAKLRSCHTAAKKSEKKSFHARLPLITEDENGDGGEDNGNVPNNMNDLLNNPDYYVEESEDTSFNKTKKES